MGLLVECTAGLIRLLFAHWPFTPDFDRFHDKNKKSTVQVITYGNYNS